ncbi:hypothetical protein AB0L70_32330 [Kribbella sp. NPDC051952]|uniref:hypothetical protein n=1 Tax=Kribbella sp. NPDC051952 TaxID=3154851 RepID=UPI003443BCE1
MRVLLCIPPLAAVVAGFIDAGFWLAVPVAMIPLFAAILDEVRFTKDELLIRGLFKSARLARQDVDHARFDYRPLGAFLEIYRRDGQVVRFQRVPKMTSSELSGDPPPPDSLAYKITKWAQTGELPEG